MIQSSSRRGTGVWSFPKNLLLRSGPKTRAQQKSIDRFRSAHHYATHALKSPERKALYEKGINANRTSAHTVAFQDYLNAPVIHYIRSDQRAGDVITIKATDDFRVETVTVDIFDPKGRLLESGNAERYPRKPFIWKYPITSRNNQKVITVRVTAMDMPGNETVMKVEME